MKVSLRLNYGGPRRLMKVVYAPGSESVQKPMIRITNHLLTKSGFTVGSQIETEYGNGIITITKLNNQIL